MEPLRFRCSSCNQSLRIAAEKAGRKVRCTRCQALVVAPMPEEGSPAGGEASDPSIPLATPPLRARPQKTAPVDEENPDDEYSFDRVEEIPEHKPKKRKKRRRAAAWRLTRIGLLLLMCSAGITLLSMSEGVVFRLLPLQTMQSLWVVLWLTILMEVIASLVQVAGFGHMLSCAFCETGALPFAVAGVDSCCRAERLCGALSSLVGIRLRRSKL